MSSGKPAIQAAGVVMLRKHRGRDQVLLVHRPEHNDWSLPKGKLNAGESLVAAALRECYEETGVHAILGPPLGKQRYRVMGRGKTVTYWAAKPGPSVKFKPNDEVDKIAWVDVASIGKTLSYRRDLRFIEQAAALPTTTPLIILRHAAAEKRADFSGVDKNRPLNGRGAQQAAALITLLAGYGIQRLDSSDAYRCVQTCEPYGESTGVRIHRDPALSESGYEESPKKTRKAMQRLMGKPRPTAVCSHRPVLPTLLAEVGQVPGADAAVWKRALRPAVAIVVHRTDRGRGPIVATERHESP
ncbi:MAG: NUDIX hydrolase [Actinomycetia bacterium]|nr:NUDIX hydrolase [Actinomycetes bacterium]